ncbi:hypothetical protein BPOR_0146g00180 [Botrytis porri]|uniref:Uncharacterized protein n=1 Tax=Botrytis porri TaxID=87229 RepID=A0A4Z1KW16_9HELO|nr:hypothetical protein BPOR_0146g00180 [Botrytis porri]
MISNMKLNRLAISLILVLSTVVSADLFGTTNQRRENLNNLIHNATDDFRLSNRDLTDVFKNTIFVNGINMEVQQRKAFVKLVSNNGESTFTPQFGLGLMERLTQELNETLFSIKNISSDDPDSEDDSLLNYIAPINLIRSNQLIPTTGAFRN